MLGCRPGERGRGNSFQHGARRESRCGRPLRLGVVGVGVMGYNHARVLADLPGVKLVGVADSDRKQRDLVAARSAAPGTPTSEALLAIGRRCRHHRGADPSASRHRADLHRRGVHVLVEKPIASSVEEGRAIIAAAQRAGVTLMVGHVERFNPAVQAIKEAISGEDILSIAITRVGPFPPRMSNVGVVIDLAVHDIDLIRWFTDSDIVEVQPQLSKRDRRARGHRAAAVPHRLRRARAHQHQLAHAVQGAHRHVATRKKYVIGDLLTRQVTECFGFQPDGSYSMRHLSVGHAEPLRAELFAFVNAIRTRRAAAGDRRGGRRQPRRSRSAASTAARMAQRGAAAPARRGVG